VSKKDLDKLDHKTVPGYYVGIDPAHADAELIIVKPDSFDEPMEILIPKRGQS
jgi:hypothetical protein